MNGSLLKKKSKSRKVLNFTLSIINPFKLFMLIIDNAIICSECGKIVWSGWFGGYLEIKKGKRKNYYRCTTSCGYF